ncbi:hypothetical protein HPB49_011999 [Dermacentor silvarum]|uniref:Uncharacterized protein n=1 Tax=Dermacentor silvarum TaxID=543639 RepID=A0ACB8D5B0_DERSI|nr:hypothetical protein HPB49_011999 [Dermacentor silvarum]
MAEPEVLTALRQQTQQQQHSRNASTTEAMPAGSAEDVTAPTEGIPHATSYDTWRVAVKLPPFWVDSPEVWFAQVEGQFSLARITQDRTYYDYVVTHLDARYVNEVRDDLANPPTANLYEHLKTALIRRLSLSEEQKIQLQSAELAERKPSQLLRHMGALAGNVQVEDSFLRALWLQRLPPHVQAILQAQVRLPLNELAEIADRVIEASLPQLSPTIQAVAAPLNTTELARRIYDINRQLTSIQQRLGERLPMQQRRHLQSRDLNTTSSRQPDNNGPCYYHRHFGDRARQFLAVNLSSAFHMKLFCLILGKGALCFQSGGTGRWLLAAGCSRNPLFPAIPVVQGVGRKAAQPTQDSSCICAVIRTTKEVFRS